jgi:Protein of unknown function (DUF4241)
MPLAPPDLNALFVSGVELPIPDGTARVRVVEVGRLTVTSGVVAGDPFLLDPGDPPFALAVPAGSHPVSVAVAQILPAEPGAEPDERIAAAMVRFAPDPAARWELAVTAAQDVEVLGAEEFFGFGVDSGTACFADPQAVKLFADGGIASADVLTDCLAGNYRHTRDWAEFAVGDGTNLVAFSSGWGDGTYPVWAGYAAGGELCALAADFFVVG